MMGAHQLSYGSSISCNSSEGLGLLFGSSGEVLLYDVCGITPAAMMARALSGATSMKKTPESLSILMGTQNTVQMQQEELKYR